MSNTKQVEMVKMQLESVTVTDKAILVISDWDKQVWVPISMCSGASYQLITNASPWQVKFTVPYWFAEKKGLI